MFLVGWHYACINFRNEECLGDFRPMAQQKNREPWPGDMGWPLMYLWMIPLT